MDDGVARALRVAGQPARLAILRVLAEDGPMSPADVAHDDAAGVSLREAAYHFRALRGGGLIVLDEVVMEGGTARHLHVISPLGRALVEVLPALERSQR